MKFFNMVKGTIDTATRKSQDAVEITKVNNQIKKREGELERLYQLLGEKVYQDPEVFLEDTKRTIENQVKNIQYLQSQIDEMKRKVLYLKDLVACDSCQKILPITTKFCPDCGRNIADLVKSVSVTLAVEPHKE